MKTIPKETRPSIVQTIARARASIARQTAVVDASEAIMARLPDDIAEQTVISCSNEWIQLCSLSREQTERAMRALAAGEWSRRASDSANGGMMDYETHIDGVRVLIYAAPPPGSCRVIEEKIDIPANTVTKRRVLCTH